MILKPTKKYSSSIQFWQKSNNKNFIYNKFKTKEKS